MSDGENRGGAQVPRPIDQGQAAGAASDDWRVLPCQRCGGEGRIYGGHPNNPNPRDDGECPTCEGTGGELVEVEPIELDDLCRNGGCQYAKAVSMPEYSCVGECQYRAAHAAGIRAEE